MDPFPLPGLTGGGGGDEHDEEFLLHDDDDDRSGRGRPCIATEEGGWHLKINGGGERDSIFRICQNWGGRFFLTVVACYCFVRSCHLAVKSVITSFPSLFPPHLFLIGAAFSVEPRAVLTLLSSSFPNYPRGVERNGFGNKTRKKTRCLTGRGKSGLDDLPLLPPSLPSFPHISSEKKTENRQYPANGT